MHVLIFIALGFILPLFVGNVADKHFNKPNEKEGWPAAGPIFAVSTACACIIAMLLIITDSLGIT